MDRLRIDHLVIVTPDLDASRAEFEALGFTTTPRARHLHLGTANHLAVLDDVYIELLGRDPDASPGVRPYDVVMSWLQAGGGLAMIALTGADPAALAARWRAAGFAAGEPQTWSRDADTPRGRVLATFTTFLLGADDLPGFAFFCCLQHTRDAVWCPEWMAHGNGAARLVHIERRLAVPASVLRERYRRLAGAAAVTDVPGGIDVTLGATPLAFREHPVDAGATLVLGVAAGRPRRETALRSVGGLVLVLEPEGNAR